MKKNKTPVPRAVIDTLSIHFPLFSLYNLPCLTTSNKVRFWKSEKHNHWYTTTELSRYTPEGDYTPYNRNGARLQNNINPPTAKSAYAAIDRIYNGYVETIYPSDRAYFNKLLSDPKHYHSCTPKITRLDVSLDLPNNVIPTPMDLMHYLYHGRGSGARKLNVAARHGMYIYSKKRKHWKFIKRDSEGNGKTYVLSATPYFMLSQRRLRRAILANEITVYIGTPNSEIKIYAKGCFIRYELSAKKTILRKLMPDRRVAALTDPTVLSRIFHAAAARIGALFSRSPGKGIYWKAVRYAIASFIRSFFHVPERETNFCPSPAFAYNNVILTYSIPLQERERPPPVFLRDNLIQVTAGFNPGQRSAVVCCIIA